MAVFFADIDLDTRIGLDTVVFRLRDRYTDAPLSLGGKTLRMDIGRTRGDAEGEDPLLRLEEADNEITQDDAATDPADGLPTNEITIFLTAAHKALLGGGPPHPYDVLLIDASTPIVDPEPFFSGYLNPKWEVKA